LNHLGAALFFLAAASGAGAEPLVAVGRAIDIRSPLDGRVVSVAGSVRVAAPVSGDVVVWGASARVDPGGSVGGDLVVLGGSARASAGSVRGRILTPGSLGSLYLAEAGRTPLSGDLPGAVATGLRLFVLAGWLLTASLLLLLFSSPVARAGLALEESPAESALTGVVVVALFLFAGVAAAGAVPAPLRMPLLAILLLLAASLKIFGMTALLLLVGQMILRDTSPAKRPAALAAGLATVGAISLAPVVGPIVWSAASVLGVGAAAATRFGSPRLRVAAV
jgi:hypothetical protein